MEERTIHEMIREHMLKDMVSDDFFSGYNFNDRMEEFREK